MKEETENSPINVYIWLLLLSRSYKKNNLSKPLDVYTAKTCTVVCVRVLDILRTSSPGLCIFIPHCSSVSQTVTK